MKLKKISIKSFRHMQNVEVEFGDYITLITGLNGTGKSSILGLAAHIFSFREGLQKFEFKTLDNKPYEAEYSELFRFCPTHDLNKEYEYDAICEDDTGTDITKNVKSRYIKAEKRFRMDVGERKEGEGKIRHPVLFLGLRRLFPLAQEKEEDILIDEGSLTDENKRFFKNESDEIFVSLDKTIKPEHVTTSHKDFFAIQTSKYGGIGNSAGQDNVGQILTAILSLRNLGKGGLLLIDEIDASLFAGAQINLIKRLYGFARQFNIQIIFTTHSLDLIDFMNQKKYDGVKTNFLETRNGLVVNKTDPDYHYIESRILMETGEEDIIDKVEILCEDELAASWCKSLLHGTDLKKFVNVNATNISGGGLINIATKKTTCFSDFLFVLDGDLKKDDEIKNNRRVVCLPGKKCPETEMYDFLKNLNENHGFWGGSSYFYKDTCFSGFVNETTTNGHKRWFCEKEQNFGNANSRLFNTWKRENEKEVERFLKNLEKAYREVA